MAPQDSKCRLSAWHWYLWRKGPLFNAWGNTRSNEARRLIDICLEAGVNLFDTADVYSDGESEIILGAAIAGRRDQVMLSTKVTLRIGNGPNDIGASRHHLLKPTDHSLRRLKTDYIDLLQLHHFDAMTPVESVVERSMTSCEPARFATSARRIFQAGS